MRGHRTSCRSRSPGASKPCTIRTVQDTACVSNIRGRTSGSPAVAECCPSPREHPPPRTAPFTTRVRSRPLLCVMFAVPTHRGLAKPRPDSRLLESDRDTLRAAPAPPHAHLFKSPAPCTDVPGTSAVVDPAVRCAAACWPGQQAVTADRTQKVGAQDGRCPGAGRVGRRGRGGGHVLRDRVRDTARDCRQGGHERRQPRPHKAGGGECARCTPPSRKNWSSV